MNNNKRLAMEKIFVDKYDKGLFYFFLKNKFECLDYRTGLLELLIV